MSDRSEWDFTVRSHAGPYQVVFDSLAIERLTEHVPDRAHVILDRLVGELYREALEPILARHPVLLIEATERNKSLESMAGFVESLIDQGVRRDHSLVAIGGGIIQDITCFLAATLLRGLSWHYIPTTLLAQADSCIGSKSSINVGRTKNIVGTFNPPTRVTISTEFLHTLGPNEIRSGIGEMLKVHAIDGPASFDAIAGDYPDLLTDRAALAGYIHRSLLIKRAIVEEDEFDRGRRAVMNYGHTFGHAIEAATKFGMPHGIAVTMGMDMANFVAAQSDTAVEPWYRHMHPILARNYSGWQAMEIPIDAFFEAIKRDKKNVDAQLRLILPDVEGRIAPVLRPMNDEFRHHCVAYLDHERRQAVA